MQFHTKNWRDDHASVTRGTYSDGTTKLTVRGRYNQILCDATISLADLERPDSGNVFIMNWGDNEGVLRALQDAGVVGRTERIIETSLLTRNPLSKRPVHECKLLLHD